MASSFVHLTETEVELLTRWQAEGKSVREIAGMLQRDEDTPGLAGNLAEDANAMELGPVDRVDRPWTVPWTVVFSHVDRGGP